MKQYGDSVRACYITGGLHDFAFPHMCNEAITVGSYCMEARKYRRRLSSSSVMWWREQTKSVGMPWLFHCWG